MTDQFSGIAGLQGRAPIGAVLRIGRKNERGVPVDRDLFYLCTTTQDDSGSRPLHPRFKLFHDARGDARKSVQLALVHATPPECWNVHLRNQRDTLHGCNPPNMAPFCTGDGVKARRWDGESFCSIACPNDRCEYRREGSGHRGKGVACKPFGTLYAQLVWERGDMPSMLVKYTTNSWNSTSALQGYFDRWDEAAIQLTKLGANLVDTVESYDDEGNLQTAVTARRYLFTGARFVLTLQEKAKQHHGEPRKYPIVTVSPIDDPMEVLTRNVARVRQLVADSADLPRLEDRTPREADGDYLENEVGTHREAT